MKKFLLTVVATLGLTGYATAQNTTPRLELGSADYMAVSIPKEFSYDNAPKLMAHDNSDDQNILVYNEDLDLVKTINIKEDKTFDYQLTVQTETREVASVTEVDKKEYSQQTVEDFIRQQVRFDPTLTEETVLSQFTIVEMENGDSLLTYDYDKAQNNYNYNTNEQMYFAYKYFGMKYPKVYWIISKGIITQYQTSYTVSYSDWKVSGTSTSDYHQNLSRIKLLSVNLNQGDGKTNYYFEVSQTLFNEDAEYEYIIPKYKLSSNSESNVIPSGDINTGYYNEENIELTRTTVISENRYVALAGFQVVSADGNILKEITFDSDFEGRVYDDEAFVITIGNTTYLAFEGYSNNKNVTVFYKVDRSTSNIQQVKKVPATMKVSPTIASKNSTINVSFSDSNKDGSEIVMVSASGVATNKVSVPAGQTSATLSTAAPTGLYCVRRIQKSKTVETKKIIVK